MYEYTKQSSYLEVRYRVTLSQCKLQICANMSRTLFRNSKFKFRVLFLSDRVNGKNIPVTGRGGP
jgi:hypothetical protein